MRLTGQEIADAFAEAAGEQGPGGSLDFGRVADLLNQRLADNLVGRGREDDLAGGKHRRPPEPAPIAVAAE